jgi:hypothetical protein
VAIVLAADLYPGRIGHAVFLRDDKPLTLPARYLSATEKEAAFADRNAATRPVSQQR